MKKFLVLLFVIISFENVFAQTLSLRPKSGSEGGNGGNSVVCTKAEDGSNSFEGTYSLDYLVAVSTLGANKLVAIRSLNESLNRIEKRLSETIPDLARSFAKFREFISNNEDYSQERVWVPSQFELTPIPYGNLGVKLPKNCSEVTQAVKRTVHEIIQYAFHVHTFSELERDPAQLSFMYVHEWLWDFIDNLETIFKINKYLHSQLIDIHDEGAIQKNLKNRGMGDFRIASQVKNDELALKKYREIEIEAKELWAAGYCDLLDVAKMKQMRETPVSQADLTAEEKKQVANTQYLPFFSMANLWLLRNIRAMQLFNDAYREANWLSYYNPELSISGLARDEMKVQSSTMEAFSFACHSATLRFLSL
jgi:hypothetical protein